MAPVLDAGIGTPLRTLLIKRWLDGKGGQGRKGAGVLQEIEGMLRDAKPVRGLQRKQQEKSGTQERVQTMEALHPG